MSKMTSIQRIVISSQGIEPDRVPVCGPISIDYAWGQLYGPNSFWDIGRDPERLAKCIVFLFKELGLDGALALYSTFSTANAICKASGITYSPDKWKDYMPTDPHSLYEGDPIKDIAYGNPAVKTLKDAMKLRPADPYEDEDLSILLKAIELANKELKGEYAIVGGADDLLTLICQLMGWTQFFMAVEKKDNELYEIYTRLKNVVMQTMDVNARAHIKAGCIGLGGHSELPCKVGSEKFFKNPEFVHLEVDEALNFMKEILSEHQVAFLVHVCTLGPTEPGLGVWRKLVDEVGPVLSFSMASYGGADSLARVKKELAPATVVGNIDPVDVMLHGSTSDVEEACIDLIKKVGPGGRFQLGPGCMIPLETPIENVKTMVNTAIKYGKYPIKL